MKQAVANPVRTGIQLGAAAVVLEFLAAFNWLTLDERQYGALLAIIALAVGVVQNAIEARKGKYLLLPENLEITKQG